MRITASVMVATMFLPPILAGLRRVKPNTQVELVRLAKLPRASGPARIVTDLLAHEVIGFDRSDLMVRTLVQVPERSPQEGRAPSFIHQTG